MAIRLYFDHNVNQAIVHGLRLRGLDVVTAREDGTHRLPDPDLLDRATALGRVLVSSDIDLVIEAHRRQHAGLLFGGVVYMPVEHSPHGGQITPQAVSILGRGLG